MALTCLEGFDGLASYSEIGLRSWRSVGAGLTFDATGGRRSGPGIVNTTTGSTTLRGIEYDKNFFRDTNAMFVGGTAVDVEIGFAFKITGTGWNSVSNGFHYPLACVVDTAGVDMVNLGLYYTSSTWYLVYRYGASQRLLGAFPGAGRPVSDRWYYVTWLWSGWEAAGTVSKSQYLLVDNSVIASLASNSVQNCGGTASAPRYLRLDSGNGVSGDLPSGCTVAYDDVYMAEGGTSGDNIAPIVGTSIGASTYASPLRIDIREALQDNVTYDDVFVASSGPTDDEYLMLDDSPGHDSDTTYVSSSVIGATAQGGQGTSLDNGLPFTPSAIRAIKANIVAKNNGEGIAVVRPGLTYFGTANTTWAATFSLPAGDDYTGLHTIGSDKSGTYVSGNNNVWTVTAGITGSVGFACPLLNYLS